MESEVRYYYRNEDKEKIIEYLKQFKELNYEGRVYEKTDQYNHPMKEYDFYTKEIDGRFRVRETIGDNINKCMITWKKRLPNNNDNLIHQEEEIEVSINSNEYNNLILLLENVLHLTVVDSYERYRNLFRNEDVEIVVDEYPFGIAIEIESKSEIKNDIDVINEWLNKLNFDINESYKLSWDDKYAELCKEQNKIIENIVRFDKDMPKVNTIFNKLKN